MDIHEAWRCVRACAGYLQRWDDSPLAARDLVNAAAVLHGVREGILTGVKRYDLETVQACGVEVTTMERADEGKWVRYKDVEALLRGSELVTNSTVTV